MQHEQLTERIMSCAMQVHRVLGAGFLESVYQNPLAHELRKAGLQVECERPLSRLLPVSAPITPVHPVLNQA